jgi:hypothetical protein
MELQGQHMLDFQPDQIRSDLQESKNDISYA